MIGSWLPAALLSASLPLLPPFLASGGGDDEIKDGHARMVELLDQMAEHSLETNNYLSEGPAIELREQLAQLEEGPSPRRWQLDRALAFHELRLGNNEAGIALLEDAVAMQSKLGVPPHEARKTIFDLGVAYMRWGETQNCVARHTSNSCLLPIRGDGVHVDQEGSKKAIERFQEVLEQFPKDVEARWLLNIAYMTIGGYPDDVPEAYRVPPAAFDSEAEFPRFPDVAPALGLNTFNLCGGVILEDFDEDGDIDVLTSNWHPRGQILYFENRGADGFVERHDEVGLTGITGGLNMTQADYDGDGWIDVLLLRGAWLGKNGALPNSLLKNSGGTFRDVTFEAGLGEVFYPTQTASWADYDNDGDLDVYIGNEAQPDFMIPCQLFQNQGDGTFKDVAIEAGVMNLHFAKGVSWGDYDNDRFPDLYVSNQNGPNRLFHNQGDGTFMNVASTLDVVRPSGSFPTWFFDFDNDGNLDIFVACYSPMLEAVAATHMGERYRAERPCLYHNDGKGGFQNISREVGLTRVTLTMGCNFGDLDNDGFPDIYLGTGYPAYEGLMPNVMYWNRNGKQLADVTTAGGFGHLQKGHAVAFGDLDGDGDQDVFEEIGGAFPGDGFGNALFQNPGFGNHWIEVKLRGTVSNRAGIGARIRCDVTEDGETRSIYKWVNSGASFGGNPLCQLVGLGKAAKIDALEVYWPTSDTTQTFQDVPADIRITVVEKADAYERR